MIFVAILVPLESEAQEEQQEQPKVPQPQLLRGAHRGLQKKLADGTQCLLGATCNFCQNPATYWYSKSFFACGTEPKWEDGKLCVGSTCNACKNPATFWVSKSFTACGTEPCWKGGTACDGETTCKMCCNGYTWRWTDANQGYVSCKYPGEETVSTNP